MTRMILVIASLAFIASLVAAEIGSGHQPFSGYRQEKLWSVVSMGLLATSILMVICVKIMT